MDSLQLMVWADKLVIARGDVTGSAAEEEGSEMSEQGIVVDGRVVQMGCIYCDFKTDREQPWNIQQQEVRNHIDSAHPDPKPPDPWLPPVMAAPPEPK